MRWLRKTFYREHRKSILAAVIFTVLAVGMLAAQRWGNDSPAEVSRGEEGGTTERRIFYYETEDGKEEQLQLDVYPLERSETEIGQLLAQAVEEWEAVFLGENESVNAVRQDLNLPEQFCEGLVQAAYQSSDYEILQDTGQVQTDSVEADGKLVELQAEFSYADHTRTETRMLKILPPKKGSQEWMQQQILQKAGESEKKDRTKTMFRLPETVGDQKILWKAEKNRDWCWILLLGGVTVCCLEWQKKDQIRREEKRRKDALMREYPQMVEQLSLLIGAGLTIRRAWERMVAMDQMMRKHSGYESRRFMEEMKDTCLEIQKGVSEKQAYEHFGQRTGLQPYRRLAAMLNRNLEKGTRDICAMLTEEAREAWEVRKYQAKKAGEEAGMKLLFPMLFLFVLILVILLFPAVQNFSL